MVSRRDEGSTMVAVVLVMFVAVVVGVSSLQMAMHANDATGIDRERVQAVQAAEAGVNHAINRLQANPACDTSVSSPQELNAGSDTLSAYQVRIDAEAGTACDTLARVIRAWGYAPATSTDTLRHLEVQVELIPQDGFRFTLFASGPNGIVTVKNTGTVHGDVYAENLDQTQNNINADSVITPGSIETDDNAIYTGVLWAGGNVILRQNGQVGGSILAAGTSAAGNVTLENGVVISKDVKARGTVSLPTTYTIHGGVTQNDPNVPPPPELSKPTFTWDPNNYSPAPNIYASAADLTAALEANRNALAGTFYVNAPSSTVFLPSHATITGPLTIVTTGKLDVGRTMSASGGPLPWQVVLVAEQTGNAAINVDQPATFSAGLEVLMFTKGEVNLKNQVTMTGAIYADSIQIKNGGEINEAPTLATSPPAGFDFTLSSANRFEVKPTLWREVAPGLPPP